MDTLFDNLHDGDRPLAERMRPSNLDDFVGQQHILGKGKLLARLIAAKKVPNVIFYGPPGTGKTTLAQIVASSSNCNFVKLNAISSGVGDAKAVIDKAKSELKCLASALICYLTSAIVGAKRKAIRF